MEKNRELDARFCKLSFVGRIDCSIKSMHIHFNNIRNSFFSLSVSFMYDDDAGDGWRWGRNINNTVSDWSLQSWAGLNWISTLADFSATNDFWIVNNNEYTYVLSYEKCVYNDVIQVRNYKSAKWKIKKNTNVSVYCWYWKNNTFTGLDVM